jgi:hypothetical protein
MYSSLKNPGVRQDMRKNSNIIKINGKAYDATTGGLLNSSDAVKTSPKQISVRQAPAKTSKPVAHDVIRHPAKQPNPHQPKPSRTLMRQAVKKPAAALKRHHKAQGHTDTLASRPLGKVVVKPSLNRLDEERLRHAKEIPRSRLISRFPKLTSTAFSPSPPPVKKPEPQPATVASPAPKKPTTTAELLDRAIEQATSHLEPPQPPKKSRRKHLKRNASIGAAMGLSVLALGVIFSQNISTVRLQMASSKAGFNVSMPGYKPAGYGLGQLNYNEGVAAVQFHSNSDDRHYTITQKRSPWDSQALHDNFVAPSYAQYQTATAAGLTIYLYGNHNATWVNNGIWYVIQSDGSLNSQQLVDLATSI